MVKALSAGQGTGSEPSTGVRRPGRFMTVTCPVYRYRGPLGGHDILAGGIEGHGEGDVLNCHASGLEWEERKAHQGGRTHGAYSLVVCRPEEAKQRMGHVTPTQGGQEKEWWECGSENSQWEAGSWLCLLGVGSSWVSSMCTLVREDED